MEHSPLSSPHSGPSLEAAVPSPDPTELKDLPESLLYSVLEQVSETGGGFTHALVCQKWAQLSMEAQRRVIVREEACIAESDLLNELSDFPNLRELKLKIESALRLTDRLFLGIGATCPHLESITIPRDSSTKTAEFSTEGLRGMISSLSRLKCVVLTEYSSTDWDIPESVPSLRNLKVLLVRPHWDSQPNVLRVPPSIRGLFFCSTYTWEGGLQGVPLLFAETNCSEVIPESLWDACSLRSLKLESLGGPPLGPSVSKLTALRQLHMAHYRGIHMPDCFSTLQLLTQLRLNLHIVQELPASLWSLTSLKHLQLHCRELTSIDTGVGQLQRLTSLDVFSRQELNLPPSLCGHSALCKLDLHLPGAQPGVELRASALTEANIRLNRETDLSRFLRGCLSLSSSRLSNVKEASSLLGDAGLPASLQNIRIWGTLEPERSLPNSFACYSNLETLEIASFDGIIELPSSIGECGRLTKLTVEECNHLCTLPLRLGSLGNLRTLSIKKCPELQCLPQIVSQLSFLEHLHLDNVTNLRSIPNSLGVAHLLRTLNVSRCTKLNCLPESVDQFGLLTSLSILHCPLVKELPASMSQLLSLRVLELAGLPALQFLPKGFEKITTLHSLTVKRCKSLRELPSELGRLQNLRKMFIEKCYTLRHLPPSIGDLVHLKRLHLKTLSRLSCIPQQIGQLSSLRELVIHRLQLLTSLPDSMTRLTGLAELSIKRCNSLAWVPELLESLSEISGESKVGLRELMVIGN